MPNWRDGERVDTLKVECVDPISLKHLSWLRVTGATIEEQYASDTRIAGTVTTIFPEDYVEQSMIRLIHIARFSNGEEYRATLGTFFALRTRESWEKGFKEVEFDLKSVLYGMENDLAPRDMTLSQGAQAKAAFEKICAECHRPRIWVSGADNRKWTKNRTLEAGKSYLTWLHEIANLSGNRLDCNPNGYVTFSKYVAPSQRNYGTKLAWNSPLVISSEISRTSNEMTVPSRAIATFEHSYKAKVRDGVYKYDTTDSDGVRHKKGDPKYKEESRRKTITAVSDVKQGSYAHIGRRGFRVSTFNKLDDLGDSVSAAQKKADEFLKRESHPVTNWTLSTLWWEVHEGDVISFKPNAESGYRKCVVMRASKELWHYTIELELKEV